MNKSNPREVAEKARTQTLLPLCWLVFFAVAILVIGLAKPAWALIPKELVFVGDSSYAPFEFVKDNKPVGMFVDYWTLWAKNVDHPMTYHLTDWSNAIHQLRRGKADILAGIFYNEERASEFELSSPYFVIPAHIFFFKNIYGIQDLEDLQGFEIGTVSEDYAEKFVLDKLPNAVLKSYPSFDKLIIAAKQKEIKVFIADLPVAYYHLLKQGIENEFRYVETPLYNGKVCAAVKKGNKELINYINTGISGITDKEVKALERKWLGASVFNKLPWHYIRLWAIIVVVVIIALAVLNNQLRYKIKVATRKLSDKQQELERAFANLKRSETKYRKLIQNQVDVIVVLDPDSGILFANDNFYTLFSKPPEELLNRSILPFIWDEDLATAREAFARLKEPPFKGIIDIRIITAHGLRWFSLANSSVIDDQDNIIEVICVGRDTTESRHIAEELFQKNNQIQAILNNLPHLAWLKDRDSRFILVNNAFANSCGFTVDEVIGRTDFEIWPTEMAAKYRADDFIVIRTGKQKYVEEPIIIDGTPLWFETFKTPIFNSKGEIIGTTGLAKDITERKRNEEERLRLETQLLHGQKMEAIGRLAGGIAHDFNNILTAILGYADLVLAQMDNDSLTVDVKEIKNAAERAAKLTKQLLVFSRKQVVQTSVVELNSIVSNAHRMLERIIGEDILLKIDISKDCGSVLIDPGQLEQTLVNLSVNARDAMPGGGLLHIQTYALELDEDFCKHHMPLKSGQYNVLVVSDSGVGMDEQTRVRIFEPFFTTKPKDKGTGLGLSTVFAIISNNSGYIDVYSEVGLGTTFKIYLPNVDPKVIEKTDESAQISVIGSETILIVEDQSDVLYLTKRVLESKGYKIYTASDAFEGYSMFMQIKDNVALLLTDVVMPGKNGIELWEELRQMHPSLKVIFMSGYPEDVVSHHGVIQNDTNYLQKPFINDVLLTKVRTVLDK